MTEKINKRIKEAAAKKAEQEEKDPYENVPGLGSPEAFLWLMWAFILDMMGVLSAILILVFGVGLAISIAVDILAMGTIGVYMYFKTKHMPTGKRVARAAKRTGLVSAIEAVPVLGDIAFSWTIYLFMEFSKGKA
ncbi:MAG: hypothetical protein WDZ40_04400 [Candidatus Spechtbacterales bacterium]